MSEGTKLGEFDNQTEFKTSMNENAGEGENLRGTKIGDVSSLEKELIGNDLPVEPEAQSKEEENNTTDEDLNSFKGVAAPQLSANPTNVESDVESDAESDSKTDSKTDSAPQPLHRTTVISMRITLVIGFIPRRMTFFHSLSAYSD